MCRLQKGKELNDFQRNLLDIEILSNLRFGCLEIRDTSVTRVTNKKDLSVQEEQTNEIVEQSVRSVHQKRNKFDRIWTISVQSPKVKYFGTNSDHVL